MSNQLQTNLDTILLDKNANLLPENLKAGVTCLGIEGAMQPGLDTSDADATAMDIAPSKSAYVNGKRIVGEMGALSSDISITNTSDISTVRGLRYRYHPKYNMMMQRR